MSRPRPSAVPRPAVALLVLLQWACAERVPGGGTQVSTPTSSSRAKRHQHELPHLAHRQASRALRQPDAQAFRPHLCASADGEVEDERLSGPTLGLSIAKTTLGAGIFSLSARIVHGPGMLPASLISLLIGVLSAWTFYLVGRAAADTDTSDNKSLWSTAVGPSTAWTFDLFIAMHSLGGVVQFYTTMSLLVKYLAAFVAHHLLPAAAPELVRSTLATLSHGAALGFVTVAMMPLCLARSLSALQGASAVGIAGVLYSVALMVARVVDGAYRLPTGTYAATTTGPVSNLWGLRGWAGLAMFLGSVNTAFLAHLNVPRFWQELEQQPTPAAQAEAPGALETGRAVPQGSAAVRAAKVVEGGKAAVALAGSFLAGEQPRAQATKLPTEDLGLVVSPTRPADPNAAKLRLFGRVVSCSFVFSIGATIAVMLCGYAIFGDASDGFLLNNFAVADRAAALLRLATLCSVAAISPLVFLALRDAVAPLLVRRGRLLVPETGLRVALVLVVHALAFTFRDVCAERLRTVRPTANQPRPRCELTAVLPALALDVPSRRWGLSSRYVELYSAHSCASPCQPSSSCAPKGARPPPGSRARYTSFSRRTVSPWRRSARDSSCGIAEHHLIRQPCTPAVLRLVVYNLRFCACACACVVCVGASSPCG